MNCSNEAQLYYQKWYLLADWQLTPQLISKILRSNREICSAFILTSCMPYFFYCFKWLFAERTFEQYMAILWHLFLTSWLRSFLLLLPGLAFPSRWGWSDKLFWKYNIYVWWESGWLYWVLTKNKSIFLKDLCMVSCGNNLETYI